MTRTTDQGGNEEPPVLSPALADILRPELASLADEIITQLREKIPEFARPIDGPYGQIMRTGVEQTLTSFVDLVADPTAPPSGRDEVALMLGRHEAEEGRSLDSLQAAYRIGAQAAWQRVMEVGQRAQLSSTVMSALADAVFRYMNDLATVSYAGHRGVRARTAEAQQTARRRLLQLILDRDDPVPLRARPIWPRSPAGRCRIRSSPLPSPPPAPAPRPTPTLTPGPSRGLTPGPTRGTTRGRTVGPTHSRAIGPTRSRLGSRAPRPAAGLGPGTRHRPRSRSVSS